MNRRDFLRLCVHGDERALELSCEHLYMAFVDAESAAAPVAEDGLGDPPWDGEPPTEIARPTTDEIFDGLARRLAKADVLRLVGTEWLSDAAFRARVKGVVEAYRERGGRVERSGSVGVAS